MTYDLAIIGGGPAGYHAAERAAEKGLKTILFERNAVGGVCLNEGCIPTKTILYSAKTIDAIKSASKYGILNDSVPTFDLSKIIGRKNKVVRKLTAGIRTKLTNLGVEIISGSAVIESENEGLITIACNDEHYQSQHLVLACGSETIIPPIKGLNEIEFWTSKEALECKTLPESLAIIGGGVIGIEFASFYNSLGCKVHVIEMLPEILGVMDKETSAMLRSEYEKKGITFYMSTKVTEVGEGKVTIEKDGETSEIAAEKILLSVGRKANTNNLGLEKLAIETYPKGIKVNNYMQTSHPRVYACGDITGFSLLAHTAIREAEVAVNHICGTNDEISYKAIPGVVYTNPEIAGIGKTEEELNEKNIPYSVKKLPMAYSGRFVAENELGNGLCKLIIGNDNKVIGCHILGNPASEIIVSAGIAIEKGFTVEDFKKIVFPHPTVGEILHECLFEE